MVGRRLNHADLRDESLHPRDRLAGRSATSFTNQPCRQRTTSSPTAVVMTRSVGRHCVPCTIGGLSVSGVVDLRVRPPSTLCRRAIFRLRVSGASSPSGRLAGIPVDVPGPRVGHVHRGSPIGIGVEAWMPGSPRRKQIRGGGPPASSFGSGMHRRDTRHVSRRLKRRPPPAVAYGRPPGVVAVAGAVWPIGGALLRTTSYIHVRNSGCEVNAFGAMPQ